MAQNSLPERGRRCALEAYHLWLLKLHEQVAHLEGLSEAVVLVHVHRLDALTKAKDHRVVLVLWLAFSKHLHRIPGCNQSS